MVRSRLAFAAFVAIALLSLDLTPLRSSLGGEETAEAARSRSVASGWPGYDELLDCARRATRPGDTVAIFVPSRSWKSGYEYAYRRAVYVLSGRAVLPVLTTDDRVLQESIDRASHIVVRGEGPRDHGRAVVCRGAGGELLGPG